MISPVRMGSTRPARILSILKPRSKKFGPSWQCKGASNSGLWTQTRCNFWMSTFRARLWKTGDETDDVTPLDKEPLTREPHSSGWGSSARQGCPWDGEAGDGPAALRDPAHLSAEAQEKAEVRAWRQDVRAAGTQTPRCGGGDVQRARGIPHLL